MTCPACGGSTLPLKLVVRGYAIHACSDCGTECWHPPSGFQPELIYDAGYFAEAMEPSGYNDYASLEGGLRRTFARRLSHLGPPREGAWLLDVGAAYGFGIQEAQRAGWRAIGIEISRHAAEQAERRVPGAAVTARASELPFSNARFDAVTLWDVVEHVTEPRSVVAEAARVLRPGGQLALTTGDVGSLAARLCGARWHLYNLPEHLQFFSRSGLRRLLEEQEFRVERICTAASHYPLGYLAERVRKSVFARLSRGAPRWPGAKLTVPVNLFDIVLVLAVRR